MRTSERTIVALVLGTALLAAPALAFDGAPVNQSAVPAVAVQPPPVTTPGALKKPVPPAAIPDTSANASSSNSLSALQYAAEDGHPVAQWKLGRMYAEGNGVVQNDLLAFDYFSRIANAHAEDSPSAPQAQIVANAFVALGRYYLSGIPNSKIKSDPERAREMFYYAASYFGNADAQFDLARLYLKGANATPSEFTYGARVASCGSRSPARTPAPTRPGSRTATTARSQVRPRMIARWRCRCSSTGCKGAATDQPRS
jgi:uncharacterized protein